jgi:PKD repeat protein
MKKVLVIGIFLCGLIQPLLAEHIKGGELYYEYRGAGTAAGTSIYQIYLKLYIDCNASNPGQLDTQIPITIFDRFNNSEVGNPTANMVSEQFIRFDPATNPCIGNPPSDVCYRVRVFSTTVQLPINAKGYTLAYQRCCRIANIRNLQSPSNAVGATYMAEIPGTDVLADGYTNNSPRYQGNDASAICRNSAFTLNFNATQVPEDVTKGDSLVYQFCGGFIGATQGDPNPVKSAPPAYPELNYQSPYSAGSPLGSLTSIDPATGIITGIAPSILGQYVITVCAYEYRSGTLINIHRKDIHVGVSDCVPLNAVLKPDYSYCDDFNVTFKNEQLNPAGSVYIWQYGDGSKPDTTTDVEGRVNHQYADTGTYSVKLKVILAGQCIDSTETDAKVYPGFFPGFRSQGTCVLLPLSFFDTTRSTYGTPSKWRWNFGDETTLGDTSNSPTPSWKYSTIGMKNVQLIVESNKGCRDTVTVLTEVRDRPPISVAFKDTLICSIDTLQLHGIGNGVWSWSPGPYIYNQNTADPFVYPKSNTVYEATLNENGCINRTNVTVRVVDFVTLDAGPNQIICLTDTTQLHPVTDGLYFTWTSNPASPINDPKLKEPLVAPTTQTTYTVLASIGKCNTSDNVTVRTIPYPIARAGSDTVICYDDTASLSATMVGASFVWSPTSTLGTPQSLSTLAWPLITTDYILKVYDTLGCPKPGVDTVQVFVKDQIFAFAGNDTSIVVGQPLQLRGTGAELIEWRPPSFLNRNDINTPVALLDENMTYIMRAYTPEGCYDFDTINIKVFKTNPDIFMPNAFHPGGTRNPLLRPIPVGMATLDYFRVYNRWGVMVFQTTQVGKGWDGTIGGKLQGAGTYVWMVSGTDYTGKNVTRKGTAVLVQ